MAMLTVERVCKESGVKLPHEVKQILFPKRNITGIEDLGLSLFGKTTELVLHRNLVCYILRVDYFSVPRDG